MSAPRLLLPLLPLLLAAPAAAQTVYVTTTSSSSDFGGAQTVADLPGPDGKVSLREAITAANNTAGPQTIGFQIPKSDWGASDAALVQRGSASFLLSDDETTIDGTTQTAFTGDTNPDGPEVEFYGYVPTVSAPMFSVSSSRNRFVGLGNMYMCGYGITILDGSNENVVQGCKIDGPLYAAVRIIGDDNLIGGAGRDEGNHLASGNDGVRIESMFGSGVPEGNVLLGNFLTGAAQGVLVRSGATGTRIGGLGPGEGNHVAEVGHFGEHGEPIGTLISIASPGNFVLGNRVGTDASGTAAASNAAGVGIGVSSAGNEIRGNVIGGITGSQGAQVGILLGSGADANVVQGNSIGVDATGTLPIPNNVGIAFMGGLPGSPSASDNLVGGEGPGEPNLVAHNLLGGVQVHLGQRNALVRNEIRDNHSSGFLGIDLAGDGPTPNDPGDLDAGPNGLQNFPELASAVSSAQGTVVTGHLDTPAPEQATVELFANPMPAFAEIVEAAEFLGAATPAADGSFVVHLPDATDGLVITATATDGAGNTSEISGPVVVASSPWSDLGQGLAGTHGTPELVGGGPLTAGSATALLLSGALESAPGLFVIGASQAQLPLLGGTLVPSPQLLEPFATDAAGAAALTGVPWPAGSSGAQLYFQAWLVDPAAPQGAAASNALVGNAP